MKTAQQIQEDWRQVYQCEGITVAMIEARDREVWHAALTAAARVVHTDAQPDWACGDFGDNAVICERHRLEVAILEVLL